MLYSLFSPADVLHVSTLMGIAYLIVLLAVIIDTVTGVQKSRRIGKVIRSSILRRVFVKLLIYYGLIIMFSFIDVLLFIVDVEEHIGLKELPYLTILAAIGAVLTEAWSVWENMPSHDTRTIEDNLAKSKELVKQVASLFNELKQQEQNNG